MEAWRPNHSRLLSSEQLPILVVDDSSTSGRTLRTVQSELQHHQNLLFGAVYCTDRASSFVQIDASGKTIQVGHSFEWILFRDYWCKAYAVDFDGVLCQDWNKPESEFPQEYQRHLTGANPLACPQKKILAIVTSRLEKNRPQTEDWLYRHNVDYDRLIMHPAKTPAEREQQQGFGHWKADIFRQLKDAVMFVESCPHQASLIHRLSGKPSLCYPTMEFYA